MDKVPSGWIKRRSGVVVPNGRPRVRRAHAIGGLLVAALVFASPVGGAVSAWSRAAVDVATLIRSVLPDGSVGRVTEQVCGPSNQ